MFEEHFLAGGAVDGGVVEWTVGAVDLREVVNGFQVDVVPVGGVQLEEGAVDGDVVL